MECQNGDVLSAVSDQAGEATLKACRIKTIFAEAVGFQDAEATSLDPQHNDFTMTLRTYPWFHIQDRLWYIRKGQLFELSRPLLTKKVMTREGGK